MLELALLSLVNWSFRHLLLAFAPTLLYFLPLLLRLLLTLPFQLQLSCFVFSLVFQAHSGSQCSVWTHRKSFRFRWPLAASPFSPVYQDKDCQVCEVCLPFGAINTFSFSLWRWQSFIISHFHDFSSCRCMEELGHLEGGSINAFFGTDHTRHPRCREC